MAALRKLFRRELIDKLINSPDQLDMPELMTISHQFFKIQSVIGVLSFLSSALAGTIALRGIGNAVLPILGWYYTQNDDPGNYKAIRMCAMYWFAGTVSSFFEAFAGFTIGGLIKGELKTVIYGLQWLVLARLWRWMHTRYVGSVKFYLNIAIKNKKDAIQSKLKERHPHTGGMLGALANKFVSEDKFSAKLAQNMAQNIPEKLNNEAGITATATVEFQKGNFVVVLVSVERVDLRKMVMLKGSAAALQRYDMFSKVLEHLPPHFRIDIENLVLSHVGGGLLGQMPANMTRQMREVGGVEVEVESKPEQEEAQFLLAALKQLDVGGTIQAVGEAIGSG